MAAQHALPGSAFRTDCLSVQQVYQSGAKSATSSCRYYARIWNVIFACLDGSADADVAWMPAHTGADDVGVLLLSNGDPLTKLDRQMNAEADRLAKLAAGPTRVPSPVRTRIDGACALVRQLAMWIGRANSRG